MTSDIISRLQRNRPLSIVDQIVDDHKKTTSRAMVWMLGRNDDEATQWFARSQDGKRQYEIWAEGLRPRQVWKIRYAENGVIENFSHTFRNEWECKNAAEVIEAGHPIDKQALEDERKNLDAILTRGGKKWEFYGVIDQKQIWAYKPKQAKHAYVIVYDYRRPDMGWCVSVRTWFKSGNSIRKLKIETIANCNSLEQAQDAILRLTSS